MRHLIKRLEEVKKTTRVKGEWEGPSQTGSYEWVTYDSGHRQWSPFRVRNMKNRIARVVWPDLPKTGYMVTEEQPRTYEQRPVGKIFKRLADAKKDALRRFKKRMREVNAASH